MELYISNSGGVPIYSQIAEQVKEKILREELVAGDALPSIRLLAQQLRISVITTKRAYDELEQSGFICTVPGKGSFVAETDTALHREAVLKKIEDLLAQALDVARAGGVTEAELHEMLQNL